MKTHINSPFFASCVTSKKQKGDTRALIPNHLLRDPTQGLNLAPKWCLGDVTGVGVIRQGIWDFLMKMLLGLFGHSFNFLHDSQSN